MWHMEKNNNKNLLYAGLAIIVVIAIALIVPHMKKGPAPAADANVSATDTAGRTQTPAVSAEASMAAWNENYQTYNGKLVVFADNCSATPSTQNQAKGATILLMNNSDTPHTVAVGKNTYSIGARHWKTTYLDTVGTINIGCDARAIASTLIVK